MKALYTILLLVSSNIFMTFAWYGHLKLNEVRGVNMMPLFVVILLSWGLAFFEYCFQVPANRIGFAGNGGPFTLFQLKIIQEVISLTVFTVFAVLLFRSETLKLNHLWSFICILGAIYFAFKK